MVNNGVIQLFGVLTILLALNVNTADQGPFLWKDSDGNLMRNGKKQLVPNRWARSVYTWLHSPLINSVEEVLEADEDRSPVRVSTSSYSLQHPREYDERFHEFFLWQDSAGNPLRFGLKQVDETGGISKYVGKKQLARSSNVSSSPLPIWENQLQYEDNMDIDNSQDLQPFQEEESFIDIIKVNLNSILNFFSPQRVSNYVSKVKLDKTKVGNLWNNTKKRGSKDTIKQSETYQKENDSQSHAIINNKRNKLKVNEVENSSSSQTIPDKSDTNLNNYEKKSALDTALRTQTYGGIKGKAQFKNDPKLLQNKYDQTVSSNQFKKPHNFGNFHKPHIEQNTWKYSKDDQIEYEKMNHYNQKQEYYSVQHKKN